MPESKAPRVSFDGPVLCFQYRIKLVDFSTVSCLSDLKLGTEEDHNIDSMREKHRANECRNTVDVPSKRRFHRPDWVRRLWMHMMTRGCAHLHMMTCWVASAPTNTHRSVLRYPLDNDIGVRLLVLPVEVLTSGDTVIRAL